MKFKIYFLLILSCVCGGGPQDFAGTLVNKDIEIGARMPDNIIWLRV